MKNKIPISLSMAGLVLLFILSFPSYKLIPFGTPDGLDFSNLYSYSTCDKILSEKYGGNFYLAPGSECGDAMGRPFIYPPLLFYSVKWVSLFPNFEKARSAWRIFICSSLFLCIFIWVKSKKDFLYTIPLFLALMTQFPAIFALERGNNDILTIMMWTLSAFFYRKEKFSLSGSFAALSILMKIYPLFSFITISLGLVFNKRVSILKDFYRGAFLTGLIIFFLFSNLWYSFYAKLSDFAGMRMVLGAINHSVQYITDNKGINLLIFLSLIISWAISFRFDSKDKTTSFAGALAISTYFSATSFDYNLITTYPLILLVLIKNLKDQSLKTYTLLFILLFAIIGNRYWFIFHGDLGYKFHILLQISSLILVAIYSIPSFYLMNLFKFQVNNLKAKTL